MEALIVITSAIIGFLTGVFGTLFLGPKAIKSDMETLRLMYAQIKIEEARLRQEQQLIANIKLSTGFQKKQKKLKKIYVVTSGIYDGYSVNKVFVSKKLANRFCDNQNTEYNCDDYRVEEFNISNK